MKIYIPHTAYPVTDKRELFILARPFFNEKGWDWNFKHQKESDPIIRRVDVMADADIVLLPFSINYYVKKGKIKEIEAVNRDCKQWNKKAYATVGGDFGMAFPEFSQITYFRMSGFRSQLSANNKGFPVGLSDHFQRLFQQDTITPLAKTPLPVIGFCGHATLSLSKRFKEIAKCVRENAKRFFQNPFRNDWEPLFASAYERAMLLSFFKDSNLVKTNFIYRNHYRAGAQTEAERTQTTLEYYTNIAQSDYVLCARGAGNFSVRFYETLMMGKIPVFVNTDCLLPFEDKINWKKHVVWIEWKDRKKIAQIVSDFHKGMSNEEFIQQQLENRKLWKETLSVKGMLEMIN
ncbi:exostosin domain-containing protein [Flavobacterium sp.]|uniref:exostosin domain-containing protein n=1 Tax=Flavobacterium sp. TaxID=239 RepID=UPI003D6A9E47